MKDKIVEVLNKGGIVVIPTDTIYGISARALDKEAVEKAYRLKDRNSQKPFIILISSIDELEFFGIEVDRSTEEILKKYWPGKVTVIFDCPNEKFDYLHLGKKSLAFRIPDKSDLAELIKKTGPLISTSANHPGEKEATTIDEAKKYFGNEIDLYLDQGELRSSPSTIIKIENGEIIVIREGVTKII